MLNYQSEFRKNHHVSIAMYGLKFIIFKSCKIVHMTTFRGVTHYEVGGMVQVLRDETEEVELENGDKDHERKGLRGKLKFVEMGSRGEVSQICLYM